MASVDAVMTRTPSMCLSWEGCKWEPPGQNNAYRGYSGSPSPLKRTDDGLGDVHAVFRNVERVLHDLKILVHHHDTPVVDIRNGLRSHCLSCPYLPCSNIRCGQSYCLRSGTGSVPPPCARQSASASPKLKIVWVHRNMGMMPNSTRQRG